MTSELYILLVNLVFFFWVQVHQRVNHYILKDTQLKENAWPLVPYTLEGIKHDEHVS